MATPTKYPTIREAMTIADVAEYCGLSESTVAQYHRHGKADLPAPKAVLAGRPVWERKTIDAWNRARQVGPGRPAAKK